LVSFSNRTIFAICGDSNRLRENLDGDEAIFALDDLPAAET